MQFKKWIFYFVCLLLILTGLPARAADLTCADLAGAVDPLNAYPLPAFDEKINAEFCVTATWYSVDLVAGHGYTIFLNAHMNSGELDFGLFESDGVTEIVGSNDTRIADGQIGIGEKTVNLSGIYYIKVFQYGTALTEGNYDLAVYNAWFNPGVTDSGRDYFQTGNTARYIANGIYEADNLGNHYYRFVASQGTPVAVSLRSYLNLGQLNFEITTTESLKIVGSDIGDILNGQTGTASAPNLTDGVYYVRIWENGNDTASGTYELSITGADVNVDTDGDGLFDAAEYYHGTDIGDTDTDGDGVSDYDELSQGSDPKIAIEYTAEATALAVDPASAILLSLGAPVSVEYSGSETWFALNLMAGHGYTFLFNPLLNRGGMDIALFDPTGTKIDDIGDSSIIDAQVIVIDKTIHENGIYYVRVGPETDPYNNPGAADGKYELTVYNAWFNPGVHDSQRSYHSTYNTAQYIANGSYAASELKGNSVRPAVYRVGIQQDTAVVVSVTAHLDLGDLDFGLFDKDGHEIASSSDSSITDGQVGTATKTIYATDVYYVRVWENGDDAAIGTYELTISGLDVDQDTDSDGLNDVVEYYRGTNVSEGDTDGDGVSDYDELSQGSDPKIAIEYTAEATALAVDPASAILLSLGAPVSVEYSGSETWFALNLMAGHGYTFLFNPLLNRGGMDIALFDPTGTKIDDIGDSSIIDAQVIVIDKTIHENGIYYVRVGPETDPYNNPGAADGKYELTVYNAWFNPGVHDSQRSYHSTYNTAQYIANGSYAASELKGNSVRPAVYRVGIQQDTAVVVSVTAHLDLGDLDFGLFDKDGHEIASSSDSSITDGQVGTATKTIYATDVYYVRVWENGDDAAIGTYELTISGLDVDQDTDSDGLNDVVEYYRGTNVSEGDTDGDGVSDYDELSQGSDPKIAIEYTAEATALAVDPVSAILLSLGAPVSVEYSGSETWFALNLMAGHGYTFLFNPLLNRGGMDIALFDPTGTKIDDLGDSSIIDAQVIVIDKTVHENGTYYVRVGPETDPYNNPGAADGKYELTVYNAWFNPGVTDSGRDYFQTGNTARYIANGIYEADNLGNHYYRFVASQGTPVAVSLRSYLNLGQLNFEITTTESLKIVGSDIGDILNGQTGTASAPNLTDGVYYVRIWENGNDAAVGKYELTITGALSNVDTDGDGLTDAAEYYHGTALDNADTDGDRISDYDELVAGKNPVLAEYTAEDVAGAVDPEHAVSLPFFDKALRVEYPGTVTWYSMDLVAGHGYTIMLEAHMNSGGLDFALFESDGATEIADSNDSNLTDGQIGIAEKTIARSGIYYLRVCQYGTAVTEGNYDLAVYNAWYNPGMTDADRDYFQTFRTARYIADGTYVADDLGYHVYRFTARQGTPVTVEVTSHLGVGTLDFSIFSADGIEVAGSNDLSIAYGEVGTASASYLTTGLYYVRVWEYGNDAAVGTYDLAITGADVDGDTDGDGLSDATEYYHGTAVGNADTDGDGVSDYAELAQGKAPAIAIEYTSAAMAGAVDMAGAYDLPVMDRKIAVEHPGHATWWALDLVAGQGITVALTARLDIGALDFFVYNSDGVKIAESANSLLGNGETGLVSIKADTSGTYYIRVQNYDSSHYAYGHYELAVYNAWFNPGITDDSREYYQRYFTARYIANGTYVADDLGYHVYRFTARQGIPVTVNVTSYLGIGTLDFGIFSADGIEVKSSNDSYIAYGEEGTASASYLTTGLYYVRVWESGNDAAVGTYELTITGADADTDTDGDGLSDATEYYHGTAVGNADTDGDGVSDYAELAQGKAPAIAIEYTAAAMAGAVDMTGAYELPVMDRKIAVEHPGHATWWALDLVTGQGITVALTARLDIGALDFFVYNSDGVKIAESANSLLENGETGTDQIKVEKSGTYYIRVQNYDSSHYAYGHYELAVYNAWFNPGITDDSREYYQRYFTARYIANGTYVADDLGYHVYRFTARQGIPVTVNVTSYLGIGTLDFGIFSADGIEVKSSNDSYIAYGEEGTASASYLTTGLYYVRVWESGNDAAVGTYELTITGADADGDTDGEGLSDSAEYYHGSSLSEVDTDNDGVTDYVELIQGRSPAIAVEYTAGDVDEAVNRVNALPFPFFNQGVLVQYPGSDTWFSMDLVAGQGVTAVLSAHLLQDDLYFGFFDEDGVELAGSNNDRIFDGETGRAHLVVHKTGTYFIKVTVGNPFYSIPIGRYELAVYSDWFNAQTEDSDRDYYGSRQTARYFENGVYSTMGIGSHWYRFAASVNSEIQVSLDAYLCIGGLDFGIFDKFGNEIAGSNDTNITNGQTGNASKTIYSSGVYYIRVFPYGAAFGRYQLTLTGVEIDADSDGDGLSNTKEYYHETDLKWADTDCDTTSDYDELVQGNDPGVALELSAEDVDGATTQGAALNLPAYDEPISVEYPRKNTWYTLDLTSGQGVLILLVPHLNKDDLFFELYDDQGSVLKASSDNRIFNGEFGTIQYTAPVDGTYFIKVTIGNTIYSDPVGKYDLAVYNGWFNPGVHDSQRDFYSGFYTAQSLANAPYPVSAYKKEFYRFTVQANTQLNIAVSAHLNIGSLDFGIFDSSFTEIGGSNDTTIGNNQTGSASRSITEAGSYYLKVFNATDDVIGYYNVEISGHDAVPIIGLAPQTCDFSSVNTGEYNDRLFTITNQGDFDLSIGEITIDGDSDFTIQSDGCSQQTLSHLETCTFRVRFTPTSGGEKSATVHIPSSDPDRPVFDIPLNGIAIYSADDFDGDGMPNQWENDNELNPSDPSDADEDPDNDELSNIEEFKNNTDPNIPDSDGDGISDGDEVHHGNDPNGVDEVSLEINGGDVLVSLTGNNRVFVWVSNWFCEPKGIQFSLNGLDPSWYTIDPEDQSFELLPFGIKIIPVQLHLPADCSITTGSHPFEARIDWEHGGLNYSYTDHGNLVITPNPNTYNLAIPANSRLAGNTILTAWETDIPTDSILYYRKVGEEDYTQIDVATSATEHRYTLTDLEWFTEYEFYTENHGACGGYAKRGPYQVKTGKAVKFENAENEFWIDRDYNQQVALTITNTDQIEHTYQLSVINENEDLVVGFVGAGSNNSEASLQPGESTTVDLVLHAPDAEDTNYDIYLELVSDEDEIEGFVDYSHAVVHVRPFVANVDLQPVASTPGLMTYSFNLINYGDTLTDIEVYVDTENRDNTWMDQEYHHLRLTNGESRPITIHSQEHTTGTIYARSGSYVVSAPFEIGCPDGTNLNTYTLNDLAVVAQIDDWYCTNKQELWLPFSVPGGFGNNDIESSFLEVEFSLPMGPDQYDPHTVELYINDHMVVRLEDTVPEGLYQFRFPTSLIHTGLRAPAQNYLKLIAEGVGTGQYIVATNFKVVLNIAEMQVDLCVPDYTPPPQIPPPPPETKLVQVGPKRKFRPGDTVTVEVELQNNDSVPHDGILTVSLENNSYNGDGDGIAPKVKTEPLSIAPGPYLYSFDYEIPEHADDIDYTVSATFENSTLGSTDHLSEQLAFWVRTPLIIIHGLKGSYLEEAGDRIWLTPDKLSPIDFCDDWLDRLEFTYDGSNWSSRFGISVNGAIKRFWPFVNTFQKLEDLLVKQTRYEMVPENSKDQDVFYFAYDWRQDNRDSAQELVAFIQEVVDQTEYGRQNIIVHSMGGLVTKEALKTHFNELPSPDSIKKLIFVGTPHLGAPDAFPALKHGFDVAMGLKTKFSDTIYLDAPDKMRSYIDDTVEFADRIDELLEIPTISDIMGRLAPKITDLEQLIPDGEIECSNAQILIGLMRDIFDLYKELNIALVNAGIANPNIIETTKNLISLTKAYAKVLEDLIDIYSLDMDIDFINDAKMKSISDEWPSLYQLLPSPLYFSEYSHFYSKDSTIISDFNAMQSETSQVEGLHGDLLENAEDLHTDIDAYDPTLDITDTYCIVGCQKRTTTVINEFGESSINFEKDDGDGRVPLKSALYVNADRKYAAIGASHGSLPSQRGVRKLIRSLLKGYVTNYETSITHPVVEYCDDCCGINGVSIILRKASPIDGDWTWPSISGPGDITLRMTENGPYTNILGSDYIVSNQGVEIFIPSGSAYTLKIEGIDENYIDWKLQYMADGGIIKTYVYSDLTLDIENCGEVTFDLTDVMTDPILNIDEQCNGNFEQVGILPSYELNASESDDPVSPVTEINISGTKGTGDWYTSNVTVTLSATDTGGSGLLATRYRFAGDAVFTDYSSTIQITEPGEHTLTYFSIDRNLNKEVERSVTIKIDPQQPQVLNVTDSGYFNLGLADITASLETSVGISGLQEVQYSVGTAPAQTDIRDWTSAGTSTALNITGLSLVENCVDQIYINVKVINGAGIESEVVSSDGVVMLEPGGDPDTDGFINEEEMTAGSNPCNENSIPKDTTITLAPGFNMIAIPAEVMFRPDLRDWLPLLGTVDDIEKVMVYDPYSHRFVTLIPEAANNPAFALGGGEALIIYAKRVFDVSFNSALCGPITLNQGFNFIGFACPPEGYTAFDLATLIGTENVSGIQRFNSETGLFETVSIDSSGTPAGVNFEIRSVEGYFIYNSNLTLVLGLP